MNLETSQAQPVADELTATTFSSAPTPLDKRERTSDIVALMPAVGEKILERFEVVAWAGMGTASVVFRGRHCELDLPVAIKVVNRQDYPERAMVTGHLRNEARMLASLRHPHLPRLWDFTEGGIYPCVITDYFDGPTLRKQIRLDGRVEQRRALRMAAHIASVLVELGQHSIVHRDIKPDNIVLSLDGYAKLIDFGLAIMIGAENPDASRTVAVPRVGTVAYLAPEQARNSAAIDARADIYSLGATLYHAVTGRLPFAGKNAAQVVLRHLEDEPAAPHTLAAHLDKGVSALILKMMAKRPGDRFADATELMTALREAESALPRYSASVRAP